MVPGRQIGPQEGIGRQPPLCLHGPHQGRGVIAGTHIALLTDPGQREAAPAPGIGRQFPGTAGQQLREGRIARRRRRTAHHIELPFQPVHGGRARDDVPGTPQHVVVDLAVVAARLAGHEG